MWLLLLLLTLPFDSEIPLASYDTYDECHSEELRITDDMRSAYPGDDSFSLTCVLSPQGQV